MFNKTLLLSIAIIYWTQLIEIHTNKFFFYFTLCTLLFIFLTSATKQIQHLLENNQLLYSLYRSLSFSYIFKTSPCQSFFKLITISLKNKIVQNNTMTTAESGLTLSSGWKILYLFLKITEAHSTFLCALHRRYFCTLLLRLKLDPRKRRSLFLCSANL